MVLAVGDKVVIINSNDKQIAISATGMAVGDKVAIIPTSSGKSVGVPLFPITVGDNIVTIPTVSGKDIAILGMGIERRWTPRYYHSCVVLSDDSIILLGGYDGNLKNDVWVSVNQGISWRILTTSAGWSARIQHSSVVMSDGSIVLMGGYDSSGYKNDVWRSTDGGSTWTQQTASASWSARSQHGSVVMSDGGIILTAGLSGAGWLNDTWRSIDKGVTWTQMSSTAGWTGRNSFGFVLQYGYVLVIAGGNSSPDYNYLNDVWASADSGGTWTRLTPAAGWGIRTAMCCVGAPAGSLTMILAGGHHGAMASPGYNDVWISVNGGISWTQQTASAGWEERSSHSCVVLSDGSLVLAGGMLPGGWCLGDVWRSTDNGVTWIQMS
jgi:hypothetical protein